MPGSSPGRWHLITVKQYAAHRGVSAPRISQLIKQGRLDAVVARKGHRVFITSAEAADEALEQTAAGPRGKTAKMQTSTTAISSRTIPEPTVPPPRLARSKKRKRITDIKPEEMTRGEAIDAKAIYDSEQSRVKAARLELDYDHAEGKLILVADAERQVDSWTARVVSGLGALPARVAQAGVPAATVAVVRREINKLREEIARE